MRDKCAIEIFDRFFDNRRKNHTHLIKCIILSGYKSIKLVKTDSANQLMSNFTLINRRFPFYIL